MLKTLWKSELKEPVSHGSLLHLTCLSEKPDVPGLSPQKEKEKRVHKSCDRANYFHRRSSASTFASTAVPLSTDGFGRDRRWCTQLDRRDRA